MSFRPFTEQDFPLRAVGQYVYRRTESGPLFGPIDPELAAELALRLNRDDTVFPSPPSHETIVFLQSEE